MPHENDAKRRPHRLRLAKQFPHPIRRRIRRHIPILRLQSQQQIPHAPPRKIRLMPISAQSAHHRLRIRAFTSRFVGPIVHRSSSSPSPPYAGERAGVRGLPGAMLSRTRVSMPLCYIIQMIITFSKTAAKRRGGRDKSPPPHASAKSTPAPSASPAPPPPPSPPSPSAHPAPCKQYFSTS